MQRSAFENPSVRIAVRVVGAAVALVIAGCGSNQQAAAQQGQPMAGETTQAGPPPTQVAGPPTAAADRPCPMQVEGASVQATDVEGGAALTFTTTGNVQDLRRKVDQMAQMHQQRHGATPGRGMGQQGGMGMGHVAVQTRVEPIEGGARMIIMAEDPAEIAQVQQHARMMAGHMERGDCPMMQDQGMMRGQGTMRGSGQGSP
jgi:hypothetical protein